MRGSSDFAAKRNNIMNCLRFLALCTLLPIAAASTGSAADLVVGVPNWPSARATANIIKVAMEERLGMTVELREASNEEIFEGMDRGTVQVHPEVWLPNQVALYSEYVEGRRTARMSPNGVNATQGVCTTKTTAEQHKISALSDLADPEKAKLFDTDFDGKGEMWIGAPSWASTKEMIKRAAATGVDKTMTLLQAPEEVALATIDIAAATGKPLVFYCYTPHHVFALHEIVQLEGPPAAGFAVASAAAGMAGADESGRPADWNEAHFHVTYAAKLAEDAPDAAKFLRQVKLDSETVTAMTYALVVERQDPAEFAKIWVKQNRDRIDQWAK
jgi:glycine betaine/proline transport system substrate-binding protein